MTPDELRKAISATFEGNATGRFAWTLEQVGHSYIELCKQPFLKRWSEGTADKGKYVLGIGGPIVILILFISTA